MRLIISTVLLLSTVVAVARSQSAQTPQITNLLTADERAAAGLGKLSQAELSALNAALTRVYVALLTATPSAGPAGASPRAGTVDLYDSRGRATVYLDAGDDLTFYLWSGEPLAYLDDESVYGFNGKHLGWYLNGRVYDQEGRLVAIPPGDFASAVPAPGPKGFRKFKPFKSFRQFKPLRPLLSTGWSSLPAVAFFAQGTK